jgi:hypothetical protein
LRPGLITAPLAAGRAGLERVEAGGEVAATVGLRRFAGERERKLDLARARRGARWPGWFLSRRRGRGESLSIFELRFGGWFGERDIDILEDLTGRDAQNAVGGFDEVVALASGVFTVENVGEGEAGGELFGLDQKACAVGDPWR